ncbi:MAG TPA: universal stress protein [Terriglobales bacterium]|nr:universal stress protein [Terriglobales bacterium]
MYTSILVPLDGSKTAEKVLPYVRFLAGKLKIPVEFFAALDIAQLGTHIAVGQSRFLSTLVEDTMQGSEIYLKRIAGSFHGIDVKWTIDKGRAAEAIIDKGTVDTRMLIAMATHGRSGTNRWLLGSVAEKVLRATANPLLLVRAAADGKIEGEAALNSIVVPLDGSELAESTLPVMAQLAKTLGLAVTLLRVYPLPYNVYGYGYGYYAIDSEKLVAEARDEAHRYLEEKAAAIRNLGVEKVTCIAKLGQSADEIIKLARETSGNLILMCSHGRSGVGRWVLGSVTEAVARHADNPVLVLRPNTAER